MVEVEAGMDVGVGMEVEVGVGVVRPPQIAC